VGEPLCEKIVDYYNPTVNKKMKSEEGIPRDVWEKRVHSKAWHDSRDWVNIHFKAMKAAEKDKKATEFATKVLSRWKEKFF
jgi:hypothetical protein